MKGIPARMKVSDTTESQNIINPVAKGPFLYIGVEMIFLTIVSIFSAVWDIGPKNTLLFNFRFFRVVSSNTLLFFFL